MSVYIYDAVRTVRGKAKPDGGLASLHPEDLVPAAAGAIAARTNTELSPDILILGAVGQVGAQGGNIALVSKFRAELPDETAAYCLNNYCTSGLTAIGQDDGRGQEQGARAEGRRQPAGDTEGQEGFGAFRDQPASGVGRADAVGARDRQQARGVLGQGLGVGDDLGLRREADDHAQPGHMPYLTLCSLAWRRLR